MPKKLLSQTTQYVEPSHNAGEVDQQTESRDSSITRVRQPSVAPIRSLTIRDPLHYTSHADLRDENVAVRPKREGEDIETTIARAVEQLEGGVEEAEALNRDTKHDNLHRTTPEEALRQLRARKLSDGITVKGKRYLEHAASSISKTAPPVSPERQTRVRFSLPDLDVPGTNTESGRKDDSAVRAIGVSHSDGEGTKSTLAAPQLTTAAGEIVSSQPTSRSQSVRHKPQQLTKISPRPTSEPLDVTAGSERPPSGAAKEHTSRQKHRHNVSYHLELPIAPRASSSTRAIQPDPGNSPATKPPPVIKFNDGDVDPNEEYKPSLVPRFGHERHFTQMFGVQSRQQTINFAKAENIADRDINLKGVNHVDLIDKSEDFDVHDTCTHASVARNWPQSRKSWTAAVACINTACLGILVGIYSGEVPAIQYRLADFHIHYTILGNVVLYCGLAVSTLLCWPLPLLHGRKPYTIGGFCMVFALQIPQGLAVSDWRLPEVVAWRILLLLSRALSGLAFGLVNVNLVATLLDLFGASLQSKHPHGEAVDLYDVRRHGGGMGKWLGFWSWCSVGTISVGFMIGTFIVDNATVDWGFWTSILLLIPVILVNVIVPEVRRAAFRRNIIDLVAEEGSFSRLARGEVKLHLDATGPSWWGQEVIAGLRLSGRMLAQPGLLLLAVYTGWVYAQFTLILVFLGALASRDYQYRPVFVGLCTMSMAIGAALAVPFGKASFFSRARSSPPRTDSMTFQRSLFQSSHFVRRVLFTILLPLVAAAYAGTSNGPPIPVAVPCVMSAVIGYFSNLAVAECYGLLMETFDTSDLQPGMTGRPFRRSIVDPLKDMRTNFSCYPRVSAGIAVTQTIGFLLTAATTGVGGRVIRRFGAQISSSIVAGILLGLTFLLSAVLWRWKDVQMIPTQAQRDGRRQSKWQVTVLGNPAGLMRKLSLLELGKQTRWSEIRRRNRVNTGFTTAS